MEAVILHVEQLEARNLAAVAMFYLDLPAAAFVGETISARIYAREFDPGFSGLQGIALDVHWNASVLHFESATITDNLPIFQEVNPHADWVSLSGASFPAWEIGRPIGNLRPEQFAELQFTSIAPGQSEVTMGQGATRIATMPAASLDSDQLQFDAATVDVVMARGFDRMEATGANMAQWGPIP